MLVMVVFFIAFRWIHLSTPLIRLFLLVLILLLMPTLNFLPVWFALDRKSGSAGMPRPISYAVFCLKKKKNLAILLRNQQINLNVSYDLSSILVITQEITA